MHSPGDPGMKVSDAIVPPFETPEPTGPMPNAEPPAAPAPKPRRRVLRVVLWIVVPIALLVGVAYWNAQRLAEVRLVLHRAKFELEQTVLSTRVRRRPALLEPAGPGTAEEVAARFADAVARLPKDAADLLNAYVSEDPAAPPPEAKDRILAAHPEPLAILDSVLEVPGASPALRPDQVDDTTNRLAISLRRAVSWGTLCLERMIARADPREDARILRLVGALAAVGADFERRGTLAAAIVGSNLQRQALSQLPARFGRGPLATGDARMLLRVLAGLDAARPPLHEVGDFERANLRGLFSVPWMDIDDGLRNVGWRRMWSGKVFRADSMDDLDVCMDHVDEVLVSLPTDPRRARAKLQDLARRSAEEPNLGRMGIPLWDVALEHVLQREALGRVVRTALTVTLYASEHGSPPASLAALVPTYLPSLPIDPWDGSPLRYATRPSPRVWSVGRDAEDDDGAPGPGPEPGWQAGDFAITVKTAR